MGYESKLIVVNRRVHRDDNDEVSFVYGDEIARFEMCGMADGKANGKTFFELFDTPIDFDLNIPADESGEYNEEAYRTDCYGKHCGYASLDTLIDWLEMSRVLYYRRARFLLLSLCALKSHEKDWVFDEDDSLVVVHYGH